MEEISDEEAKADERDMIFMSIDEFMELAMAWCFFLSLLFFFLSHLSLP